MNQAVDGCECHCWIRKDVSPFARESERATGVMDRKTIRRREREAKSSWVATGSEPEKTGGEAESPTEGVMSALPTPLPPA